MKTGIWVLVVLILAALIYSYHKSHDAIPADVTHKLVNVRGMQKQFDPHLMWSILFVGKNKENTSAMVQTNDGGFIVAGQVFSKNQDIGGQLGNTDSSNDIIIIKVGANGIKQWETTLGGSGNDGANGIVATTDGSYTVVGYTYSNDGPIRRNHGNSDVWVVKLNCRGEKLWSKVFGGVGNDGANAVVVTRDGGFAITGYTSGNDWNNRSSHRDADIWVLKLDSAGTLIWQNTFGGSDNDDGYSIVESLGGSYLVTGYADSNDGEIVGSHGNSDLIVAKLNGSGTLIWCRAFGGTGEDEGRSLVVSPSGGYTVVGYSTSNDGDVSGNHGGEDMFVIKVDENGNKQWFKILGGLGDDRGNPS